MGKGMQYASHLRKKEVEENYDVEDLETYDKLIKRPLRNYSISIKRLERRPKGYYQLESRKILPKWPGRLIYLKFKMNSLKQIAYNYYMVVILWNAFYFYYE